MREQFGDIWELATEIPNSVVCITTNGYVNSRGKCVMGKGVAKQAKQRYPGLAKELGAKIKLWGNHCHALRDGKLLSFPTKHVWWRPSSLELIQQSAEELYMIARSLEGVRPLTFLLPRPGCQNGGLKWSEVEPVLAKVGLPNSVIVVTNDRGQWIEDKPCKSEN